MVTTALCLAVSSVQAPGDEPVWRQLLEHLLEHGNPDELQATAALASWTL
jgi:hypothetical protein